MERGTDPFQLRNRGITDERVLAAMTAVPREEFVPFDVRHLALADHPLDIGFGQTISQPFIVAWMTQALGVEAGMRVLEVGTGCGYQTAILAEMGAAVWSLEIVPELFESAERTLTRLGYESRVRLRLSNGYDGWPEEAPFDRIVLTAAPPVLPPVLLDQLADNGRLIAPVGVGNQVLVVAEKRDGQVAVRETLLVRFVEMRREDRR